MTRMGKGTLIVSLPSCQKGPNLNIQNLSALPLAFRNIAKGTTDPRVGFISQIQTQILIKFHLQNLDQASTSKFQPNFKFQLNLKFTILSRISTKIQLHNLYKTSAAKYQPNSSFKFCLNFNFKILTKPCAQSLNKSLAL